MSCPILNTCAPTRWLGAVLCALASTTALAQQADDSAPDDEELDEIVVTAHMRDWGATSARTAFGLNLNLLRTPAAVSVISQDLLKDQQVNNVDEALRNVAGVTRFKTGNGGEEKFSIRGFDASQSIYKDGARVNNSLNVSNIPSTEVANIERIEVLKGPSALLYGEGSPGGVINYITKTPLAERYTSIELLAGSDSFYKVEFDTTGPLSDGSDFGYRVVGSYEDSESFRNDTTRQRLLLNPVVSWTPSDNGRVIFGIEYIDDDYTQDRGQVLDGNFLTGYFYSDRLDSTLFFGIPGHNDATTAKSTRIYLRGDYQFNDSYRLEATYSKTDNDKDLFDSNNGPVSAAFDLIGPVGDPLENYVSITPFASQGEGETDQFTFKNFLDFRTGDVEHQILASLTYETFETSSVGFASPDTVFYNIATGQYGINDPFTPVDIRNTEITLAQSGSGTNQDYEETGINVLDYMTLNENWAVLLGLRWSDYEDNLSSFDDDDLSFRGGIVYSPRSNLSFYLSYAEGYQSSGGRLDLDDNQIDPVTSESWEVGAKWATSDEHLIATATLFEVEERGVAFLANPQAPPDEQRFGNLGAYESKGLELEIVGMITDNWRVQAGYTFLDNEITEGGATGVFGPLVFAYETGNRLPGIAEHALNLSTFYELPIGDGALGLGGSVFYQDDIFASAENNYVYEGWTQLDAAAYYRWGRWKAQVNVRNLTDEDYRLTQALVTPDIFAAFRVGTGQPRTVIGSVSYEF